MQKDANLVELEKMLSNAYFLAKFRFDTAENEPAKNLQLIARFANFAPATLARCDAAQAAMRTTQMLPSIANGQGPSAATHTFIACMLANLLFALLAN